MVWKAWIPIYNLCDGVGIGYTTKFHQNTKNQKKSKKSKKNCTCD